MSRYRVNQHLIVRNLQSVSINKNVVTKFKERTLSKLESWPEGFTNFSKNIS